MTEHWRRGIALWLALMTVSAMSAFSAIPTANLFWAYVTDDELVAMRGTTEVSRISNYFSDAYGDPSVARSRSGTHLAFISDAEIRGEPAESVAVVVVSLMTDTQVTHSCPSCDMLIPFGGSDFLASDGRKSWVVDPDAGTVTEYAETPIGDTSKAGTIQDGTISLLGSTPTAIISERVFDGKVKLLSSPLNRSRTSTILIGNYRGFTRFVEGYEGGHTSHRVSGRHAVTRSSHPGECLQVSSTVVFDEPRGQEVSTIKTDRIEPTGFEFGVTAGLKIDDIWSASDGGLWALISTWSCTPSASGNTRREIEVNRLARLFDDAWNWSDRRSPTGRIIQYRALDDQTSIVLRPRTCVAPQDLIPRYAGCVGGELFLEGATNRKQDENVLQVYGPWMPVSATRPVAITSASLGDGLLGYQYADQLIATSGRPPYAWAASGLPRGLSIDPNTGRLTGVPEETGSFKVTFTLSDHAWGTDVRTISLNVGDTSSQPRAISISSGDSHTCAIADNRELLCWGANASGQLGIGNTDSSSVPRPVVGLPADITSVATGSRHTCAVASSGDVYCWGNNSSGELGIGSHENASAPVRVHLPGRAVSVGAGFQRTCAVVNDGAVYCWGNNLDGALGDGTDEDRSLPTRVKGLPSRASAVRTGGFYSCAVAVNDRLWCWGNLLSQLGRAPIGELGQPRRISGLEQVRSIATSDTRACASTLRKPLVCWGAREESRPGELLGPESEIPEEVTEISTPVLAIATGDSASCALTADGEVHCWGPRLAAGLGRSTEVYDPRPVAINGLDDRVKGIAVGESHVCALLREGRVQCWGNNFDGEVGDGTTAMRTRPVRVVGLG